MTTNIESKFKERLGYDPLKLRGIIPGLESFNNGYNSKGIAFTKEVLKNIRMHPEAENLKEILIDNKNIKETASKLAETYQKGLYEVTIDELKAEYNSDIDKYLGKKADNARQEMNKYEGTSFGEIARKYELALHEIEKVKKGLAKPKDVKDAIKTQQKYETIYNLVMRMEKAITNPLKAKIENKVSGEDLQELFKTNNSAAEGYELSQAA